MSGNFDGEEGYTINDLVWLWANNSNIEGYEDINLEGIENLGDNRAEQTNFFINYLLNIPGSVSYTHLTLPTKA